MAADENVFKAIFDDTDAIRFLDNIEKKVQSLGNEAEDMGKAFSDSFSDIRAAANGAGASLGSAFNIGAAQGLTDALKLLQKEYDDLKTSSATLKNALKGATDPTLVKLYARGIADLEKGMVDLEKAGKAAGVNLKEVNKQAGTGKQVFEGLFGQITKAGLLVGAIQGVVTLTKYAVNLSQELTRAQKTFEAFTGSAAEADKIVQALVATGQKNFIPTDQILQAGKALLAFGENADNLPDVLTRIANVSAATGKDFNELTTIYGKARAAGVLYAEDINQLVDAGIPIIQEFAKQLGVSNDQVKKLASEGKIGFEELQLAMFNLTAEGGKFADQTQIQSDSISGSWSRLVAVVQPAITAIGSVVSDVIKGILDGFTAVAEFIGGIFSDKPKIEVDYTGRDAYEKAKDDLFERERLEKEAEKARAERNKKAAGDAAKAARDLEALRISAMQEGTEKQIAQENFRFNELVKQLKKHHLSTEDAEIQHQKNLTEITYNAAVKLADDLAKLEELRRGESEFEKDKAKRTKEENEKILKQRTENIEAIRDLENKSTDVQEEQFKAFINLLTAQGADERLIAEKQFEFDQLVKGKRLETELQFQESLLALTSEGDTKQIEAIKANIELVKAQIATLGTESLKPGDKAGQNSIWSLFGADDKDGKERFDESINIILDGLNKLAEARIAEAAAAVAAAETKVDAAQQALDEELKLKEDGEAANVALRTKELNAAKAARDQALREETKARRAQILLDSATQVSSLITTAANIFKGFSSIPLVGQILAVASVAAMFTAFAASKAVALKAVNAPKLRKGEKVIGRTHEQGGELRELEHNEQVIGAPEAAGNDVFFDNLRKGKYKGLDLAALAERRGDYTNNPLAESASSIRSIERRREAISEQQHFKALEQSYEKVGNRIVDAINKKPVVKPWKSGYKETVTTESGTVTKTVQPE